MLDVHNHFTNINSILCTSELLPQNIKDNYDINCIQTSEIGLDKRFTDLLSMDNQIRNLQFFLEYAKDKSIPVTIHSVHTTEVIIKLLKEIHLPENTVIWHGFNGSAETAKELSKLGVLISIGPKYTKSIEQLYRIVPALLLETDYEGNSAEEHDKIIENQYTMLSELTGLKTEILNERITDETKAFKNRISFR